MSVPLIGWRSPGARVISTALSAEINGCILSLKSPSLRFRSFVPMFAPIMTTLDVTSASATSWVLISLDWVHIHVLCALNKVEGGPKARVTREFDIVSSQTIEFFARTRWAETRALFWALLRDAEGGSNSVHRDVFDFHCVVIVLSVTVQCRCLSHGLEQRPASNYYAPSSSGCQSDMLVAVYPAQQNKSWLIDKGPDPLDRLSRKQATDS
jgi:hypothetical protein